MAGAGTGEAWALAYTEGGSQLQVACCWTGPWDLGQYWAAEAILALFPGPGSCLKNQPGWDSNAGCPISLGGWALQLDLFWIRHMRGASWVAQWWRVCLLKQETRVWSLGLEDLLEKEMAKYSSILIWEIPENPGGLQSMGSQKSWTWPSD